MKIEVGKVIVEIKDMLTYSDVKSIMSYMQKKAEGGDSQTDAMLKAIFEYMVCSMTNEKGEMLEKNEYWGWFIYTDARITSEIQEELGTAYLEMSGQKKILDQIRQRDMNGLNDTGKE